MIWCPTVQEALDLDLNLDPMTLILKPDLDMIKMSHHTKNEVSMLGIQKL